MKVLGIGNALVDVIVPLENDALLEKLKLPRGSMQLIFDDRLPEVEAAVANIDLELASGGSAANTIHGLAALGLETAFIGSISKDNYGNFFEKDLIEKGIIPKLRYSETPTGRAHAFVSADSERTFGTYLGAALELGPEHLTSEMFEGYDWLYIEGYLLQNHVLIKTAVELARNKGLKVALDLASYNVVEDNLEFLENLLKNYVDLVFANEEESKAMTGQNPEEALLTLSSWCEQAVVKIGKKGSLLLIDKDIVQVDSIQANAVDTSGAGDIYAAGYMYGLSKELNPIQCGQIGALTSGRVVEYMGPKLPLNAWADVLARIKQIESYEK
ncbi:MAG: adenosine kinase [Bacteroidales bacterium]|nr:adenosine kinase [Bacteroidales bacterium]